MLPHLMVKDATTASSDSEGEVSTLSDPQGLGHALFDAKDEISTLSYSKGEVFASFDP